MDMFNIFVFVVLLHSYLLFIEGGTVTMFKNDDDASRIENFIARYLSYQDVTIIYNNDTAKNLILTQSFPKILYNYDLRTNLSGFQRNSSYIFLLNNREQLKVAIERCITIKNWNSRKLYLLIYQNSVGKNEIKQSFNDFWLHWIFNVVIYSKDNGAFYTWYPYAKKCKCGRKVNLTKVGNRNPYLGKLPKRVHRCPVNITWDKGLLINPFSKEYPGSLVLFMNTLAYKINLNVNYMRNNTQYLQRFYSRRSVNELFEDMERRSIDMVLFATIMHHDHFKSVFEISDAFFDDVMFLVFPSRKAIKNENYVVNMFTPICLIAVVCSLGAFCIFWKLLSGDSWSKSFFLTVQLTLQMATSTTFKTRPIKILVISFLLFMVCLVAAYQTQMSTLLTTPTLTPKIESIEQFAFETDIKYNTFKPDIDLLENDEMRRAFKNRLIFTKLVGVNFTRDFIEADNYAIDTNLLSLNRFKNREKLEVLRRSNKVVILSVAVKRGFPLLETINYWIREMRGKGFDQNYASQYYPSSMKVLAKEPIYITQTPLTLGHVKGPFYILIYGCLFAMFVFLIEIFVKKY